MSRSAWSALLAASALLSCAPEVPLERTGGALTAENGKNLNGRNLNGKNLNGSSLGSALLWVSLDDVMLEGIVFEQTTVDDSELHAVNGNAAHFRGIDLVGAQLDALSVEGHDVRLRIADVTAPVAPDDVWRYQVEYRETDGDWLPICLSGGEPLAAIPVAGYWDPAHGGKVADPDRFTFACPEIGAIGKCVEAGYRPWASAGGVPLDAHHQACVRLLRADYCGDGVSYTEDGKLVNLYDDLGVQDDTEDWAIEAEWDRDGARCLSVVDRSLWNVPCYDERARLVCGDKSHFDAGTLLMSETAVDLLPLL